jgi:hypothetical protein
VLVQPDPNFAGNVLSMMISFSCLTYHDLAVSFEGGGSEGGIAYTVQVTLPTPILPDPVPVKVTTTVVPWKPGSSGSGDFPGWDETDKTR